MKQHHDSVSIENGKVLLPNGKIESTDLLIEQGKITEIGTSSKTSDIIDADGAYVLPGFIDIHTHGIEKVSSTGSLEAYAEIEASRGITTFFPTFFGPPEETADHLAHHLKETDDLRRVPQVGGFRLESPYLAVTGGGRPKDLVPIHSKTTDMLMKAGGGHIKLWDISPELPSAPETIRFLTSSDIICSIAHTEATLKQALAAVDAGARLVTHLFDAFAVLEMIDPGVYPHGLIDYFLIEDRVACEIIPDGTHVHPMLVEKTFRCKSTDRVVFVTDSNYGAGLPAGDYDLPQDWGRVRIDGPNNGVRLIDRDMGLCGSALTQIDSFRNAIQLFGRDIAGASRLCSTNQARLLNLNKGAIAQGKDADLVILDADFEVQYTIVAGAVVYQRPTKVATKTPRHKVKRMIKD